MTDWPDWLLSDTAAYDAEAAAQAMAELVRYVDMSRTRGYVPADCLGHCPGIDARRARAENLYEALRAHRILYAHEPWNQAGSRNDSTSMPQRIRGPIETVQSPATCLDLALVFAGMAMAADMRPLIAVRFGPAPHALVILDVGAALSDREDEPTALDGFTMHPDRPGVWTAGASEHSNGPVPGSCAEQRDWRIVDVFRAARHRSVSGAWAESGEPYSGAVWSAGGLLSDSAPNRRWALVDVDYVRADQIRKGLLPYTPPAGSSIPAIHGYLPALPAFTQYPSRQEFLRKLHDLVDAAKPPAVVILQGEAGLGKSMLAQRLAVAADNGCGWFLNATDAKVLTTSLAQAERQEKTERGELIGRGVAAASGEKPDPGDDQALASAALTRLREAERPWVVVLDNCDSDPSTPGLAELVPQPHQSGQFVIITTTHPRWLEHARQQGWQPRELPWLDEGDLDELSLPRGLDKAVAGRPLIAQALAALRSDAGLPESAGDDGPGLVWNLLSAAQRSAPEVIALARLLAWSPPEPTDAPRLIAASGLDASSGATSTLEALRFVTPSGPATVGESRAIQMHRLFAEAVRTSTWSHDPAAAAWAIDRLLTTDEGQGFFIGAADTTALIRLERGEVAGEPGDVARAVAFLADVRRSGLLWHGLGHVRERRGPVSESAPPFAAAAGMLDPAAYPFQVAECLIGQARVVYQKGPATNAELIAAREMVEDGRRILEPLTETDSLQLREQGNALAWLITQRIAGREEDLVRREELLAEVRDNLWLSYECRRSIIRPKHNAAKKSPPESRDGLGPERAYYNLAGVNIQLAKVHHRLAMRLGGGPGSAGELFGQVAEDLEQAANVYAAVRTLRELRYGGRPHPHLAACVHGQALVAYFRAVLLGQTGELADTFRFAAEAMEQRRKVVSGLAGPGSEAVLRDGDMRKSVDFIMKAAAVTILDRHGNMKDGTAAVRRICDEAGEEWSGPPLAE
jgi:hypothetical protein